MNINVLQPRGIGGSLRRQKGGMSSAVRRDLEGVDFDVFAP